MSDHYVTVASYRFPHEAQLALNVLEEEGIRAFLDGELTANVLSGIGEELRLQVHEHDAQRATRLLAEIDAQAGVDDDWEDQAESCAWTCELCGAPINNRYSACPACKTPSPHVQKGAPSSYGDRWADRRREERVQARDQITSGERPSSAAGITDRSGPEEAGLALPAGAAPPPGVVEGPEKEGHEPAVRMEAMRGAGSAFVWLLLLFFVGLPLLTGIVFLVALLAGAL